MLLIRTTPLSLKISYSTERFRRLRLSTSHDHGSLLRAYHCPVGRYTVMGSPFSTDYKPGMDFERSTKSGLFFFLKHER